VTGEDCSPAIVPEYVAVGHITQDVRDGGLVFGGTVTYATVTARNLGHRAAILTALGPAAQRTDGFASLYRDIAVCAVPSDDTTIFENRYTPAGRVQYLRSRARTLDPEALSLDVLRAPIVHLAPLTQEVPATLLAHLPADSLVGVTPQGWMRQWDDRGLIAPARWATAEQVLARADALVFSEEDTGGDVALAQEYVSLARLAVITRGARGCTLYVRNARPLDMPAFPAHESEPTGAGDVFAAAFFLTLAATGDPEQAGRFANCVASFAVEAPGTEGIPTREQVEQRLRGGTA
jgi:sugar/nucleoside kinase (ribokinase family)